MKKMDDNNSSKNAGGKSLRPVRNRRYSRKSFAVGNRPAKRLFTPEIKRFLKEWLIRRRDNPYPNREEKKLLAVETGLTYIQICNWFANWRRKLKNVGKERNRKTWGHLIKTYNDHAQGNVEQFSICSDDSIWGESDPKSPDTYLDTDEIPEKVNYNLNYSVNQLSLKNLPTSKRNNKYNDQCYQISSTTEETKIEQTLGYMQISGNKYKNHIMDKYLKGLGADNDIQVKDYYDTKQDNSLSKPVLLSKWLESAANFQPQKSNYVSWSANDKIKSEKKPKGLLHPNKDNSMLGRLIAKVQSDMVYNDLNDYTNPQTYSSVRNRDIYNEPTPTDCLAQVHGQEEVEAAEALTRLAGLYRS